MDIVKVTDSESMTKNVDENLAGYLALLFATWCKLSGSSRWNRGECVGESLFLDFDEKAVAIAKIIPGDCLLPTRPMSFNCLSAVRWGLDKLYMVVDEKTKNAREQQGFSSLRIDVKFIGEEFEYFVEDGEKHKSLYYDPPKLEAE